MTIWIVVAGVVLLAAHWAAILIWRRKAMRWQRIARDWKRIADSRNEPVP